MTDYMDIPEHTRHSLMLYVTEGLRPGRGLQNILGNNLFSTVACCDDATLAVLRPLITWVHSFAPSQCHGSKQKVDEWLRAQDRPKCYDTQEGLVKLGFPDEAAAYVA